ncbi:MAG: quinone oxidoreductase [Chloroflexales bacterium]|nr:quinone oxidoreductase [Chloroflexales bacterium]
MRAIRVHQPGGAEALVYDEVPLPEPGSGAVRVKLVASGVNFIDIYHRTGLYKLPLPFILGQEGAGTVDAVGEGVRDFKPGDRVAYASVQGSYAEYVVVPAAKLVPVPDATSLELAAAVMLQGMTAHYLAHSTYALKPGDTALVHAAAGGVGLLLVQIAKRLGATVIGTVSTDEKAQLARAAGADQIVRYDSEDFEAAARQHTGGAGVHVVYDSVGRTTFDKSLNSLRPRGTMVLFGQSSGPVPPVDLNILNPKGSLFVTRPSLGYYTATRDELLWRAGDLLRWIGAGELDVRIDRTVPLAQAAEAQRALESRATSGKVLLAP